jgi:hypothetical protein
MKQWMAGVVAVSLMVVGCGSSECDQLGDADIVAVDNAEDCRGMIDEDFFVKTTESQREHCKEGIDECSDDEKQALADLADCLEDLSKCSASNPQAYVDAHNACEMTFVPKLGAACVASIYSSSMKVPASFGRVR